MTFCVVPMSISCVVSVLAVIVLLVFFTGCLGLMNIQILSPAVSLLTKCYRTQPSFANICIICLSFL